MHAIEFDVDDGKPEAVVRRHREDKHTSALNNPLLVRRYDRRARGAWRRKRRDAKRNSMDAIGGATAVEEEEDVCDRPTTPPVPMVCDWEVVDDTPATAQSRWFYQRFFAWLGM